jgi:hypothetical protein
MENAGEVQRCFVYWVPMFLIWSAIVLKVRGGGGRVKEICLM